MFRAAVKNQAGDPRLSDQALMELVVHRDPRGLEQLYDRYSSVVYSLLRRITGQSASADELLQEVFLRLWGNASAYVGSRGAVAPWLLTMARNIAIDHLRSKSEKQRRLELGVETFPSGTAGPNPEQWLDRLEQAKQVRTLIGNFPEKQRRALELAYFQGLTQSEIAREMEEPLGTVKTWIRSGLRRLREAMEEVN